MIATRRDTVHTGSRLLNVHTNRADEKGALRCPRAEAQAKSREPPWTPFERTGQTVRDLEGNLPEGIVWRNSRYQVVVRNCGDAASPAIVWLSIKRHDGHPARDWRDLQRTKNELVGTEVEALELFPAESRLVDNANQTHVWCFPGFRFPFGFQARLVSEGTQGVTQRPFSPDNRPADLTEIALTREELT